MDDLDAVPNPEEDLKHAHMLLAQMSPEELLRATYALEEIIEQSSWFLARLEEAAKGPSVSMDDVLAEYGLTMDDLEHGVSTSQKHGEAA